MNYNVLIKKGGLPVKNYETLLETAMGSKKSALVLKNGKIINVFTGEILSGDIAVEDGYIAGIGSYEGEKEVDLEGRSVAVSYTHLDVYKRQEQNLPIISRSLLIG